VLLRSPDQEAYPGATAAVNGKSATAAPEARPAAEADQADEAPASPAPRRRRPLAWAFALLVILVALAGLLAARLAAGPVSLTWAIPLIEWVLADETGPVDVGAATATLGWRDWQRGPTLGLGDVTATSPKLNHSLGALSVAVSLPATRS
jgi:hypothetical protein